MSKRRRWWSRRNMTDHHSPPRSSMRKWRGRLLRKEENRHTAYHILFGNAGSFEECVNILRHDWWPQEEEKWNPRTRSGGMST